MVVRKKPKLTPVKRSLRVPRKLRKIDLLKNIKPDSFAVKESVLFRSEKPSPKLMKRTLKPLRKADLSPDARLEILGTGRQKQRMLSPSPKRNKKYSKFPSMLLA